MSDRFDQIVYYAELLGIDVAEEDFGADIDAIADAANETFWEAMYTDGDYDLACDVTNELIGDQLLALPYITEQMDNIPDWDESDEYDAFRDLIQEEIFDRADIPEDEMEAEDRIEHNDLEDEEENI